MPRANKKDGAILISVMMPPKLKKQLDQMARETGRTRSGYVQIAVAEQLKNDGAK